MWSYVLVSVGNEVILTAEMGVLQPQLACITLSAMIHVIQGLLSEISRDPYHS